MNKYLVGAYVIGAGAGAGLDPMAAMAASIADAAAKQAAAQQPMYKSVAVPTATSAIPSPDVWKTAPAVDMAAKKKERELAQDERVSAARTVILSGVTGSIIGLVGGALLWKAHRVAGALVGGLLVGPPIGYGVGLAIAAPKIARTNS